MEKWAIKRMIFVLLLSADIYAHDASRDHDLEFRLECIESGGFNLVLINQGNRIRQVASRFHLSPRDFGAMHLSVVGEGGVVYPYIGLPRILPPYESDRVILAPGQLLGSTINQQEVLEIFKLESGTYTLTANYQKLYWFDRLDVVAAKGYKSFSFDDHAPKAVRSEVHSIMYPIEDYRLALIDDEYDVYIKPDLKSNQVVITVAENSIVSCVEKKIH